MILLHMHWKPLVANWNCGIPPRSCWKRWMRVLVFVENTESFAFLYDNSHWPPILAERTYTTKTPSIPPQLSLVLPSVSLQIEWEEFVEVIKAKYVDIVNVIRFKNKAQVPVPLLNLNSVLRILEMLYFGRWSVSDAYEIQSRRILRTC